MGCVLKLNTITYLHLLNCDHLLGLYSLHLKISFIWHDVDTHIEGLKITYRLVSPSPRISPIVEKVVEFMITGMRGEQIDGHPTCHRLLEDDYVFEMVARERIIGKVSYATAVHDSRVVVVKWVPINGP